jgi:hypothetical protein
MAMKDAVGMACTPNYVRTYSKKNMKKAKFQLLLH